MSTYPNQFARIGISDAAVLSRLSDCFSTIFFSPENNFYHQHPTDPDAACMVDTGNNDARTEGMSYGMMMCVQMNRKDLFDKLWTFSMRYMHLSSGVHQGYFDGRCSWTASTTRKALRRMEKSISRWRC